MPDQAAPPSPSTVASTYRPAHAALAGDEAQPPAADWEERQALVGEVEVQNRRERTATSTARLLQRLDDGDRGGRVVPGRQAAAAGGEQVVAESTCAQRPSRPHGVVVGSEVVGSPWWGLGSPGGERLGDFVAPHPCQGGKRVRQLRPGVGSEQRKQGTARVVPRPVEKDRRVAAIGIGEIVEDRALQQPDVHALEGLRHQACQASEDFDPLEASSVVGGLEEAKGTSSQRDRTVWPERSVGLPQAGRLLRARSRLGSPDPLDQISVHLEDASTPPVFLGTLGGTLTSLIGRRVVGLMTFRAGCVRVRARTASASSAMPAGSMREA